jgi:hypothetical protein
MNSMIPLLGRQPQINDPLETAGNAASLSNLLQVNQMRQRQMDAEDAQRAAMQHRMMLGKRAYQEAADTYNKQNSAARTAAATAAANAPQEMAPGAPMPGSANAPLVQGQEASPYVSAEGADAAVNPIPAVGSNMMSDPKFHEIFALTAKDYGLDDIAEMAMKHRSELLKEQAPQSEPYKIISDAKRFGGSAGEIGDRALDKATGLPPGLTYKDGKVVADQAYIDAYNKMHPHNPLVSIDMRENKKFDQGMKLKQDFMQEPSVKAYAKVKTAFRAVEAAFKNPGPAGDTALATKFMKILDEDSVVRESEFAIALQARGLWDIASNYANMVVSGQKLTPTQRKEFYKIAGDIKDAAEAEYNRTGKEYRSIADRHGLDSPMVTGGSLPVEQKIESRKEAAQKREDASQNTWTDADEARLQQLEREEMERARGN